VAEGQLRERQQKKKKKEKKKKEKERKEKRGAAGRAGTKELASKRMHEDHRRKCIKEKGKGK